MKRILIAATGFGLTLSTAFAQSSVEDGRRVAIEGDCIACHTVQGGEPFAGGLPIPTPLGTIYSTNITPDPETGIGTYSFQDFDRAMRQGIARNGHNLYPAMPYPAYTRMTDQDMRSLYAYFMNEVKPVALANKPSDIAWPLNMRWPLKIWNALFVKDGGFKPDPAMDEHYNRGAYLVEGPGHCSTCHTPRGLFFQEKALSRQDGNDFLSGSLVEGWFASSLRDEKGLGLGDWSERDIAIYLKTGRNDKAAATGGMAEVIKHSTSHMPESDLLAVARYLKSLAPRNDVYQAKANDQSFAQLRNGDYSKPGALEYSEYCQSCHRADGQGMPGIYPALANNSAVLSPKPTSVIKVTLEGARMPDSAHHTLALEMPGFPQMSDSKLANVVNFIRTSWGNNAAPVSAADVASQRAQKSAH